jgi:hypothetical protein
VADAYNNHKGFALALVGDAMDFKLYASALELGSVEKFVAAAGGKRRNSTVHKPFSRQAPKLTQFIALITSSSIRTCLTGRTDAYVKM